MSKLSATGMSETGRVLEALLSGQFICQISDEDGYAFLAQEANRERIDSHLHVLNRRLASACEGELYFCAYRELGDSEHKVISQQFSDIAGSLLPLTEWLILSQEAQGQDAPISAGVALRLSELQTVVEDTPALREQLAKISQYRLFGSTSTQVDGQLKQIFKRLCEQGYLVRPNQEKQIYIATAKVDYIFEVISFIDEAEGLGLEQQAMDAIGQQEPLL
ncbi:MULTISPECIES: condensin complex protein MksE [unclassified Agarivorans]|uniref:condensin complex protein MksE n=1 Tax=unclassified Agarivorans TaxID=2636026 RepID=UPI0026E427E3|nr:MULTISPECIES: hypothetical protein [unclassified Agarivorans]MDO6685333.1 hypothetical protein [Agarivorans sp. 3_MG-2023]MDO6715495.1 hypothetical protein [Agarivorans sp. 2_MG-2023]MDO6763660.1 hypothetical protein [Agarivorans sp. 1_MG-2023]